MKRNTKIILGLFLSAALFSCSKEDTTPVIDGDPVVAEFQMGIATRAHDGQWDANDDVGVTMLTRETREIIENVYNYDYYTPTEAGIFQARNQGKTIYFPQDGSSVTFKAYYPYTPALSRDMLLQVNVSDQTSLPRIDLMTADHLSGFSKQDRIVHLNFRHRLSKMIFKLVNQPGQEAIALDDISVSIDGMYREGSYDLLAESMIVNTETEATIAFPYRNDPGERYGIVLPRPAASGVTFTFKTSSGDEYVAAMSDTLNLNPGYQYTFYVTLQQTSAQITADIEPWIDGPTTYYDALQIGGEMGSNEGAITGDVMQVYLQGTEDFDLLADYTYNGLVWNPSSPVYWENIPGDPAILRASLEREPALNNTQMPDVLVSETISVARNRSAHFVLERAATKVFVELTSNTFTSDQLNRATIVLPGYRTGGEVVDGAYVEGPVNQRGDILVDRDDPSLGVALFNPQDVSPEGAVVRITIDGRDYTAYAGSNGMTYRAGVANKLVINLDEQATLVSARIVEWKEGTPSYLNVVEFGPAAGANENVTVGMEMYVQMTDAAGIDLPLYKFTYDSDDVWRSAPPIYWDDLTRQYTPPFEARSWINVDSEPLNDKQMPDVLVSNVINITQDQGANFILTHVPTKVFVVLESSTFSPQQLNEADIVLPSYKTGGAVVNGIYSPGPTNQREDIPVDRTLGVALFNPQQLAQGDAVVRVTIDGRDYTAYAGSNGMDYEAGVANKLVVNLDEQAATVSAHIVEWKEGTPSYLNVFEIGTPAGGSENVADGTEMSVFLTTEDNVDLPEYKFTYESEAGVWRTTPPIYWENLPGDGPYTGRSWIVVNPTPLNNTQLPDYLVAEEIRFNKYDGANFTLTHAEAQVVISLTSSTFSPEELSGATVTLPNYEWEGSFSRGSFIPGNTRGTIIPEKDLLSGARVALIQEQTVAQGNIILTVGINGNSYNATAKTADFVYTAGQITYITVFVDENMLTVSATAVDWDPQDPVNLNAVLPTVTQEDSENILDEERMTVYYYITGNTQLQSTDYTYDEDTDHWSSNAPIFWDNLDPASSLKATLFRQETAYHTTQVADQMILEDPLPVPSGNANVHFEFVHPASKVFFQVVNSDFTPAEIEAMTFTLPGYIRGGAVVNGTWVPGQTTGDITAAVDENGQTVAIIDPIDIQSGSTVVRIRNQAGRVYDVPYTPEVGDPDVLSFRAGESTLLRITLTKTQLGLSATAIDWDPQNPVTLTPTAITVTGQLGDTDDFFRSQTIHLYKWGGANAANFWWDTYSYIQGQNGFAWSGNPRYWDDQVAPLNMTAIYYPAGATIPTVNNNTGLFPWNASNNQSTGYTDYDILTSYLLVTAPQALNFEFVHALSKVTVVLVSDEFTTSQLVGSKITLNNFVVDGQIVLPQGTANYNGSGTTVTPLMEKDGAVYSALLMPGQTIPANTNMITITLPQYDTPFQGSLSTPLTLVGGKNHILNIRLRRTAIEMSATVKDWEDDQIGEIVIQ